jgi:hypothetical protein
MFSVKKYVNVGVILATCVNLRRQMVLNFCLITEIYESELQGYLTHNTGIYLPKFFSECREFDFRWGN